MTPCDYEYLRRLLKQKSGLVLSADKQYLVESRLLPIARKSGVQSLGELVVKLKATNAEPLIAEVVEAMTTNETFFYRDKLPFENFRSIILPELIAARAERRRLRIWCAACSTGQEPYSLAMSLREMGPALNGWRIEIVATDLSQDVIQRARAGLYSQFEVQRGLPITLLVKYFTQVGENWEIASDIRAMVKFRQLNLLRDFSALGWFDVVLCRNVLIYFDSDTKCDVLQRMAGNLQPDGFLLLGAAETVIGLTERFMPYRDRRGVYVHNTAAPAAPATNVVSLDSLRAAGR